MKNLTDITIILDKSGSIQSIKSDIIGGFNSFVADQKSAPGKAVLSLIEFSNTVETTINTVDITKVEDLTDSTFRPGGLTALYDAIGSTIDKTGERLNKLKPSERPDNVIFVILTDGYENASRDYSSLRVKELVKHQQEKYNWNFIFVGANQDAVLTSATLGINKDYAVTYTASSAGVNSVMGSVSANIRSFRVKSKGGVGGQSVLKFSAEDRFKAIDS